MSSSLVSNAFDPDGLFSRHRLPAFMHVLAAYIYTFLRDTVLRTSSIHVDYFSCIKYSYQCELNVYSTFYLYLYTAKNYNYNDAGYAMKFIISNYWLTSRP